MVELRRGLTIVKPGPTSRKKGNVEGSGNLVQGNEIWESYLSRPPRRGSGYVSRTETR